MTKEIKIEDLPFDITKFAEYQTKFITEKQSMDALAREYLAKKERCSIFFKLLSCGLVTGCGFMLVADEIRTPYLVTRVDAVTFDIVATKYDFWKPEERIISVVDKVLKTKIDSIIGMMETLNVK